MMVAFLKVFLFDIRLPIVFYLVLWCLISILVGWFWYCDGREKKMLVEDLDEAEKEFLKLEAENEKLKDQTGKSAQLETLITQLDQRLSKVEEQPFRLRVEFQPIIFPDGPPLEEEENTHQSHNEGTGPTLLKPLPDWLDEAKEGLDTL